MDAPAPGPCDSFSDWVCDENLGECGAYCELDRDRQVLCDDSTCYEATGTFDNDPCDVDVGLLQGCDTCEDAVEKGCGGPW